MNGGIVSEEERLPRSLTNVVGKGDNTLPKSWAACGEVKSLSNPSSGVPCGHLCSGVPRGCRQKILAFPKESIPLRVIVRFGDKLTKGFEHLYLRLFRQAFKQLDCCFCCLTHGCPHSCRYSSRGSCKLLARTNPKG